MKDDGGIIGITENESAMQRWMIVGPDMAGIVSEVSIKQCGKPKCSHHEQTPSTQDVFNEMGNPFTETSSDLFAVTRWLMKLFRVLGKLKIWEKVSVDDCMINMTKSVHGIIPKNNLTLFKSR